jgi:hypothetical protein
MNLPFKKGDQHVSSDGAPDLFFIAFSLLPMERLMHRCRLMHQNREINPQSYLNRKMEKLISNRHQKLQ